MYAGFGPEKRDERPRSGPASAPQGTVPNAVAPPHATRSTEPDHFQAPVAISSTAGREVPAFMDHLREEGKPGLVSFLGNAFRVTIDEGTLSFFFDKTHANLIPMIKSPNLMTQLNQIALSFFTFQPKIQFSVGSDPKLAARVAEDQKAMEMVREHPTIKYLLQTYNAKIVSCQLIQKPEE